jgi:mannose-6-phosphate isomerase-like protein (cupin superfamily)
LGVQLSTLLGDTSYRASRLKERAPMVTRLQQKLWVDPDSGFRRRTLTPPETATVLGESLLPSAVASMQLTDNLLPPRARVAFVRDPGPVTRQQQIWVLSGSLALRIGEANRHLDQGDCIAMLLDQPIIARNSGSKDARFITVTAPHQA